MGETSARGGRAAAPGRTLRAEGLANARDLGGLRRRNGSTTPEGVFFRSANVDALTEEGWEQIREAGIRTVVDLRQPGERAADRAERPSWLTTVHVDLDGLENQEFWAGYWDNGLVGTALYFLPHLEAMPARAGSALAALATAAPGGVLFHCVGGRDRTGMIALLLLAAVGVEPEEIVDDYLETVRFAHSDAGNARHRSSEESAADVCRKNGTTTEGAFRQVLAGLDVSGFLDRSGLDERERAAILSWRGGITA